MIRRLFWLWCLLVTPARPFHEATHMIVAYPFAEVAYDATAIEAVLEWHPQTPVAWVRVAHLAPTIVGVAIFPVVVAGFAPLFVVLSGVSDGLAVLVLTFVATNWVIYSWPSYKDRHPFDTTS